MPAVTNAEIASRVLRLLFRLINRVPQPTERLAEIFPNWPGLAKIIAEEFRYAGEFWPFQMLLDPQYLATLTTVQDLIEVVILAIESEQEEQQGGGAMYSPESAGVGGDEASLGFELAPRDFSYSVSDSGYITVPVWFATDRATTGKTQANDFFGAQRNDAGLTYGVVEVTIPNNHIIGQLEAPSFWRFQFTEDFTRHILLGDIFTLDEANFFSGLRKDLEQSNTHQAFVFIHGYNVTFKDAARRAGQIARDLAFPGVPILYSWPSQGRVKAYPIDSTNAQWTVPHLEWFLGEVAKRSGAKIVHLIAHSMGNLALIYAIKQLAKTKPIFHEIILTAPDIDAGTFKEVAALIRSTASRVTLYASARDRALRLSKRFNGYPRAGDAVPIVITDGIDTIDASAVSTDVLGHSYFGNNRTVLSDMHYVVRGVTVADRAGITKSRDKSHWLFRP